MTINVEKLKISIAIQDRFTAPLQRLSGQLAQISAQVEEVEDISIDVDVNGLTKAKAKLAGLQAGEAGGVPAMASGGQIRGGGMAQNLRDLFGIHAGPGPDERISTGPNQDLIKNLIGHIPDKDVSGANFGRFTNKQAREFFDIEMPDVEESMGMGHPILGKKREGFEISNILDKFNLRMSSLHNLVAKLIPLMAVFVGALPAAITAIGTLGAAAFSAAAALGAIGGLAFLGLADSRGGGDIMAGMQDILKELRESFLEALLPLAKSFTPLARDALAGLENLFNAIAARGQTLKNLEDTARAFGGFMLDVIPSLLQTVGQLADAFSGVFAMAGEWLQTTDIIGGFVSVTQKAFPALMSLVDSLIVIVPALVEMSVGFLRVADAILVAFRWFTQLLGVFSPLLDLIGLSATNVGMLVGSFLTLATVLALASKLQAFYAGTLGGQFVAAVYSAIGAINAKVASLLGLQAATWGAYAATAALLGVLTFGLAPILGSIASSWFGVSEGIKDATKSMERFNSVQGSTGISGFGAGSATGPVARGSKTSVTNNNIEVVNVGSQSKDEQWQNANKIAYINKTQSPTK